MVGCLSLSFSRTQVVSAMADSHQRVLRNTRQAPLLRYNLLLCLDNHSARSSQHLPGFFTI